MTYNGAIKFINSRLRFGSMPGLERICCLLDKLGKPQDKLKFVHVAGTNGKGSISTMTACIAKSAGYKTGLYISPFVTDFRERMQINNRLISRASLVELVELVQPHVEQMDKDGDIITEFELNTAIALLWYANEKCDLVVLEVGLGGLYDATNVISSAQVSVITSISYDHTSILGNTLAEIAHNKCGIFKAGCPAVVYPLQQQEAMDVIRKESSEKGCPFISPDLSQLSFQVSGLEGYHVQYQDYAYHLSLMGEHQVYNSITVIEVIKALNKQGFSFTTKHVATGIEKATIPARFEILSHNPMIVVEGGHNPSCGEVIGKAMGTYFTNKKVIGIAGMVADKDIENTMKSVMPHLSSIITLAPESPRALTADALASSILSFNKPVEVGKSYAQALERAIQLAGKNGVVFIFGSFFLAGKMRTIVKRYLKQI